MDREMFRAWLAEIDGLTAKQRQELDAVLAGRQPRAAVAAAIEERLGEARRCPHCGGASVGGGQGDGLRRFRCKDCRSSFNALTGTPLARLWSVVERGRDGGRLGRAVRGGGEHGVPLATSLPARRQEPHAPVERHRRSRRNLYIIKP